MLRVILVLGAASLTAHAHIIDPKLDLDNSLHPNVIPTMKRYPQYVSITKPLPGVTEAADGQPLVLECQALGSPNPTVAWLRNGEPISDLEEESNEILSSHPSSIGDLTAKLVIGAARHGDVYTCLVNSGHQEQASSTTIYTVPDEVVPLSHLDEVFRSPLAPVITARYGSVLQVMGTAARLPCRAHSRTRARVLWTDNEDHAVNNNPRFKQLPSGDLLIMDLQWSDMGNFQCTVTNAYGSDTAATFIYPLKP